MDDLVNTIKSTAFSIGEKFVPVLSESQFRETGVLTPEEFVTAGDHLVYQCPTWSWMPAVAGCQREFLPPDKQYLVTRNVPCLKRCRQIDYDERQEKVLDGDEADGGDWVDTHHFASDAPPQPVDVQDASALAGKSTAGTATNVAIDDDDDDDDDDAPAMDMDEIAAGGALEAADPNEFVVRRNPAPGAGASSSAAVEIERPRTYDIHISYDKFHQVPRLWLVGYDESGQPLTTEQMYEDLSAEHLKKTVTRETQPHTGIQMASVHPCKHASMMKRLMGVMSTSGKELPLHHYLLVFLKFAQAVIPTMEYDYTRSVQL